MIAIDTSEMMAILLAEADAKACMGVIESEPDIRMSAGPLAEALIVASGRDVAEMMRTLVEDLGFSIVSFTIKSAHRVAEAYRRWEKGAHPAGLNLGDRFVFEIAATHRCPLFYIGNEFTRIDIESALDPKRSMG